MNGRLADATLLALLCVFAPVAACAPKQTAVPPSAELGTPVEAVREHTDRSPTDPLRGTSLEVPVDAPGAQVLRLYFDRDESALTDTSRAALADFQRELAVRDYLVAMGTDPDAFDTLSFGEELPAVAGHDEAAWSRNRRVELRVP